jgi:hypothetical protein
MRRGIFKGMLLGGGIAALLPGSSGARPPEHRSALRLRTRRPWVVPTRAPRGVAVLGGAPWSQAERRAPRRGPATPQEWPPDPHPCICAEETPQAGCSPACPRSSPQGPPEARPYPFLRRMASPSPSRAALRRAAGPLGRGVRGGAASAVGQALPPKGRLISI